jgi:hypothetical protein
VTDHRRGLADLPRPGHHLDEAAWVRQPAAQLGGLGPLEGDRQITQHDEYFYSEY